MDRAPLVLLAISAGSVFCTNFPPVSNPVPIPVPPQPNIPVDFDAILPEITNTYFKAAERIPDSFTATESTTERPASDVVQNDANLPKAATSEDEWSPPSGTIGPVATPRPDEDSGAQLQPENESAQFLVPLIPENAGKQQTPGLWVISRGITGQYTEQQWIPMDSAIPREPPTSGDYPPGGSSNKNVPDIFPVFPPPVRPDLVLVPRGKPQVQPSGQIWIPRSVSSNMTPRSFPKYGPPFIRNPPPTVVVIQNGSFPFAVQPPPTVRQPSLFPPLQYVPKQIVFPAPKAFALPVPPVTETPTTSRPVEETSAPTEAVTSPTTTPTPVTSAPIPPPSPPPPPPPPPYFVRQSKELVPLLIPSVPMKFNPSQTMRSAFPLKINADNPFGRLFPKTILQPQDKIPVPPSPPNAWINRPNNFMPQFPPQNSWYQVPLSFSKQKTVETSSREEPPQPSASDVTVNSGIPPPSSDLWIIRETNYPQNGNDALFPVMPPSGPLPKPKIEVPEREDPLPSTIYQGGIPSFPSIPRSFPIYPTRTNSSASYRLPFNFVRKVRPSSTLPEYYFLPSNRLPDFFYSRYSPASSSQLGGFPFSYPSVRYPVLQQLIRKAPQNCSSQTNQNRDSVSPPFAFYVRPPQRQSSYTFVPIRPAIPDLSPVVYEPVPAVDLSPAAAEPATTETPLAQETENSKRNEPESVVLSELLPPEVSATDNVVISPIFPFINQPVAFPKPAVLKGETYRSPYFFGYGQSDSQGALQHRREEAGSDGTVKGSYGYRDANGVYRKVDYTAGKDGYRAVVQSSEPGMSSQQNSEAAIKVNENSSAGSSLENNTPESET